MPQKNYERKLLSFSWVQDIEKWFEKWHAEEYLDVQIEEKERDKRTRINVLLGLIGISLRGMENSLT